MDRIKKVKNIFLFLKVIDIPLDNIKNYCIVNTYLSMRYIVNPDQDLVFDL